MRFCGSTHHTAEKSGVFPVPCCNGIPTIPHRTLPGASPESRRSTLLLKQGTTARLRRWPGVVTEVSPGRRGRSCLHSNGLLYNGLELFTVGSSKRKASSEATQAFLLIGALVLLPVILIYTGWSYWVFRGKVRANIGYH